MVHIIDMIIFYCRLFFLIQLIGPSVLAFIPDPQAECHRRLVWRMYRVALEGTFLACLSLENAATRWNLFHYLSLTVDRKRPKFWGNLSSLVQSDELQQCFFWATTTCCDWATWVILHGFKHTAAWNGKFEKQPAPELIEIPIFHYDILYWFA